MAEQSEGWLVRV